MKEEPTRSTGRKPAARKRTVKRTKIIGKSIKSPARSPRATSAVVAALARKNKTEEVDAFMAQLEHPFKEELEAVRKIIMGVNKQVTEEIKWAAPTFSYKGYIVTIHVKARQQVHLIFHNAAILNDQSGLLLGDYVDRRMMYFTDMKDVKAKKATLEKIVQAWIDVMDRQDRR